MHELGLAQRIIQICDEARGGRQVVRVELVVGSLAAVVPEALRFAFDALKDGTALEDAELVIQEELACARCESCGRDLLLQSYLDSCPCGRSVLTWQSGSELSVRRMEVR